MSSSSSVAAGSSTPFNLNTNVNKSNGSGKQKIGNIVLQGKMLRKLEIHRGKHWDSYTSDDYTIMASLPSHLIKLTKDSLVSLDKVQEVWKTATIPVRKAMITVFKLAPTIDVLPGGYQQTKAGVYSARPTHQHNILTNTNLLRNLEKTNNNDILNTIRTAISGLDENEVVTALPQTANSATCMQSSVTYMNNNFATERKSSQLESVLNRSIPSARINSPRPTATTSAPANTPPSPPPPPSPPSPPSPPPPPHPTPRPPSSSLSASSSSTSSTSSTASSSASAAQDPCDGAMDEALDVAIDAHNRLVDKLPFKEEYTKFNYDSEWGFYKAHALAEVSDGMSRIPIAGRTALNLNSTLTYAQLLSN